MVRNITKLNLALLLGHPIHTSSICNNALYAMILMKLIVARFVGTGGFLITLSTDHNK
jgi:hypothetical protein